MGHQALDFELTAGHEVSLLCTADNQALRAHQLAIITFIPKSPKMVMCRAVSLILPKVREWALRKRTTPRQVRVTLRPQATNRRHLRVKISRSAHTPRTPSPVLVSSSASTRTLTQNLTLGRKFRPHGKSNARAAPRRKAPQKTPVGCHPQRKSHQLTRCFKMKLGKKHGCLTNASMLGVPTKSPTMLQAGQHEIP